MSQAELVIMIVAGIDWKLLPATGTVPRPALKTVAIPPDAWYLEQPPELPPKLRKPTTLCAGTPEIKLTHRRPLLWGRVIDNLINEEVLLDSAFETRQIGIIIESGEFHLVWNFARLRLRPIYGLRLTLAESPYPPLDRWKPEEHPTVAWMHQCEMTQFCARKLPPRTDSHSETVHCAIM
ncbi:hypothetical protein C8R43DRAFT_1147575 [Mycena crocata]|nr:hypothetical protein C8R43DRAFT_1147575 [Mycena crocata]